MIPKLLDVLKEFFGKKMPSNEPFASILKNHERTSEMGWEDVIEFYKDLLKQTHKTEWIFRGQNLAAVPSPLLKREIEELELPMKDALDIEYALLDRFKRNVHIYEQSLPRDMTSVEYLALMRHYGAPTRLLDFTYSVYVALFFALENIKKSDNCQPVIWAIDALWMQKKARKFLGLKEDRFMPGKFDEDFKKYFLSEIAKPFVYQITPDLLNPRLSVQQGTFLCPGNIQYSLDKNFGSMVKGNDYYKHIKLLKIKKSARNDILKELYRMNITRASLFPGVSGFTESLKTILLFPTTIEIYGEKRKAVTKREAKGGKLKGK